jgi:hypothetical protein
MEARSYRCGPSPFGGWVLDHMDGDTKIYREADLEEAKTHPDTMMHSALVLPVSSQFAWRAGGVVYDSGTGAGFARKRTRDGEIAYRKVRVRA